MILKYKIIPKHELTYLKYNIKYVIFSNATDSTSRVILLLEPCELLQISK